MVSKRNCPQVFLFQICQIRVFQLDSFFQFSSEATNHESFHVYSVKLAFFTVLYHNHHYKSIYI